MFVKINMESLDIKKKTTIEEEYYEILKDFQNQIPLYNQYSNGQIQMIS